MDSQNICTRSVYGGVQFGLGRFDLTGQARMGVSPMRAAATGLKTSMVATARSVGPMRAAAGLSAFRTISPMRAAAGLSATRMASPMRAAAGLTATRMMGAPRGIDLNLGQFDLTSPIEVSATGDTFKNVSVSRAFWKSIDSDSDEVFDKADKALLTAIFSPSVSDRREEGAQF